MGQPVPLIGKLAVVVIGGYAVTFLFLAYLGIPHGLLIFLSIVILSFSPECYRWGKGAVRYELGEESVVIVRHWPFGRFVVPLCEIESASRPVPDPYFRLEGTRIPIPRGGMTVPLKLTHGTVIMRPGYLVYYVGAAGVDLFASVTDAGHLVLLESPNRSYLISPEDPDQFIADLGK